MIPPESDDCVDNYCKRIDFVTGLAIWSRERWESWAAEIARKLRLVSKLHRIVEGERVSTWTPKEMFWMKSN